MRREEMLHGRFITATEFRGQPVTLTIAALDREAFEREDGTEQSKWIIAFREQRKTGEPIQWVLNRTNIECLFAMWDDTEQWVGKRVTLYPERDSSPVNETGWCIRIKGSPDIPGPINVTIKLPRRKPVSRRLVKTAGGPGLSEPPAYEPDEHEREHGYPAGIFDDDEPAQGTLDTP